MTLEQKSELIDKLKPQKLTIDDICERMTEAEIRAMFPRDLVLLSMAFKQKLAAKLNQKSNEKKKKEISTEETGE